MDEPQLRTNAPDSSAPEAVKRQGAARQQGAGQPQGPGQPQEAMRQGSGRPQGATQQPGELAPQGNAPQMQPLPMKLTDGSTRV